MKKKEADMTNEEWFTHMKYGIIAVKNNHSVVHFCGYHSKPDEETFAALDEELQSDPEFHLIGEDYDLVLCPQDLFDRIIHDFNIRKSAGEINWMRAIDEDEDEDV